MRLLVIVKPELDSVIMMFPPSITAGLGPSLLILLHEMEGTGKPSAEHVNTASSGATTVSSTGGVAMTGAAVWKHQKLSGV